MGEPTFTLDSQLVLDALEQLRLAPIWTLRHSPFEIELGEDFNPHKWTDVRDAARGQHAVYQRLLEAACAQRGVSITPPAEDA